MIENVYAEEGEDVQQVDEVKNYLWNVRWFWWKWIRIDPLLDIPESCSVDEHQIWEAGRRRMRNMRKV